MIPVLNCLLQPWPRAIIFSGRNAAYRSSCYHSGIAAASNHHQLFYYLHQFAPNGYVKTFTACLRHYYFNILKHHLRSFPSKSKGVVILVISVMAVAVMALVSNWNFV